MVAKHQSNYLSPWTNNESFMFPTQYLIPKVYIAVKIYWESCITQQFESVNLEDALLNIM